MIVLSAFCLIAGIISVILYRKKSTATSDDNIRVPQDENEHLILEDKKYYK